MKWYNGITDDDWPINGGEFVEKNGYGHEVLNFQKNGRYVYGYVQARKGTIDINRLDPNSENYVDDVLIAWRAKSSEGAVIIGWYKNARVFRHGQGANSKRVFEYDEEQHHPEWHIRADYKDAFLIPPGERAFKVPVTHKGFGSQTFVSYLQDNNQEVNRFKRELLDYIEKAEKSDYSLPQRGKRKPIDQDRKLLIEKTAIDKVTEYYCKRGYDIESREKNNMGYDLLATKNKEEIYIEVKGTSVADPYAASIGLTPNEYKNCKRSRRKYRICIVCDSLANPQVYEFMWNLGREAWIDIHTFSQLEFTKVISANLKISEADF